ncbi:MAG: DUF4380 domain-containing protein [Cytophagaceae bacterium]
MIKRIFPLAILMSWSFVACNPTDEKVASSEEKNDYTISIGDLSMELDPQTGGRIVSINYKDHNFLTGADVNEDNWGSTFWPSPQKSWGWPPSEELDKKPYSFSREGGKIILTSEKDSQQGIVVKKEFEAGADTSILITYTIINSTTEPIAIAPWEITRVAPGGITFYPSGKGEKRGDLAPLTKDTMGITYFVYDTETIPGGVPKLLSDGSEGWMAQVNGNYILIKKFVDISPEQVAPEEGEIELYANPDRSYIEIEQQGALETVPAGDSYSWKVTWYLRELPQGITVPANDDLLGWIRNMVK